MSFGGFEVRVRSPLDTFALEVSFEADSPAVGLFGPSGSGKTSVLEAIAGWRPVDFGYARVGDRVLVDTRGGEGVPIERRGIGYVPQDGLLFPHWTVRENVTAGAGRGAPRASADATERALDVLELAPLVDRLPENLSGGERQRVALARALCSNPDVLLLDEPLGALDLPLRRRILPYLVRVREAFELPMLFVSHDPTEVCAVCEHVVVLSRGRVLESGPPAEVLSGPGLHATGFENVLRGEVLACSEGTADVRVAEGAVFRIPRGELEAGDHALFGLRADDVLLATGPIDGLSARNRVPATIDSLVVDGDDVYARCRPGDGEGAPVWVSLTPAAVRELELEAGRSVSLVVKTQSCHRLA